MRMRFNFCPALLTLAIVCGATPVSAQERTTATDSSHGSSSPGEGIKVHGDWTITLRNPDGSIARVHEFKNALSAQWGAPKLMRFLNGTHVPGPWAISLVFTAQSGCAPSAQCLITEPAPVNGYSNPNSHDLIKDISPAGVDAGKLVLRGSVRMTSAADLSLVTTSVLICPVATPLVCVPYQDAVGSSEEFTRRVLSSPIAVAADQLVEIKVVISFS